MDVLRLRQETRPEVGAHEGRQLEPDGAGGTKPRDGSRVAEELEGVDGLLEVVLGAVGVRGEVKS